LKANGLAGKVRGENPIRLRIRRIAEEENSSVYRCSFAKFAAAFPRAPRTSYYAMFSKVRETALTESTYSCDRSHYIPRKKKAKMRSRMKLYRRLSVVL
jgi:hypothetical protein